MEGSVGHPERDVSDMKETCGIHARYMRDTCILRGNIKIHAGYMRNTCGIHAGHAGSIGTMRSASVRRRSASLAPPGPVRVRTRRTNPSGGLIGSQIGRRAKAVSGRSNGRRAASLERWAPDPACRADHRQRDDVLRHAAASDPECVSQARSQVGLVTRRRTVDAATRQRPQGGYLGG